jgi:glutathione peroxidase
MLKNLMLMAGLLILIAVMGFNNALKNNNSNTSYILKNLTNNDIPNISDISVKTMDGNNVKLSDYTGKVLLIVNVASNCGYTPQYDALEKLYKKYNSKGFEILAFPCNDFGGQEPGTNEEIKTFCQTKYNVTFTLFDKIKVLGDDKCPLFARLIQTEPSGDVKWNFEKFLIDKNGNVIERFRSKIKPDDTEITSKIEELLVQN